MLPKLSNAQIAWRAAQDVEDGAYVNLGIGFPEMVAKFQPPGREAIFHTENGILNFGDSCWAPGTSTLLSWVLMKSPKTVISPIGQPDPRVCLRSAVQWISFTEPSVLP
jgi:hypothetical protein